MYARYGYCISTKESDSSNMHVEQRHADTDDAIRRIFRKFLIRGWPFRDVNPLMGFPRKVRPLARLLIRWSSRARIPSLAIATEGISARADGEAA